jgi:hypothetical protein
MAGGISQFVLRGVVGAMAVTGVRTFAGGLGIVEEASSGAVAGGRRGFFCPRARR